MLAGLLSLTTITAAGAAATAASAAPASSASASSLLDKIPASVRARMLAQAPLVDAASVIRTAVKVGQPRGYAGLGLVGDHVTLWWRGGLPADITASVEAARRIVPIVVEPAAYSGSQLKNAAARLKKVVTADPADAAYAVRIKTDGSGLEVLVDTSARARIPKVPAVGVPVGVVHRSRPVLTSTRLDDSAPWSAGTSIFRLPGVLCTAGFGVRDLTTQNTYLMTAGHCSELGAQWMDRTGEPIGTTVLRNQLHDDELIATDTPGSKVYVGGSTDGVQARVIGWTAVFPGQLLCQSGNTSAEVTGAPVCNLQVQYENYDDQNLVVADQLDGQQSARGGDSGGPVYQLTAAGNVLAAGTSTWTSGIGFGFQDFSTYRDDFGDLVPVTGDAPSTCRVSYQITDSWSGGYTANVTIYNSGPDVVGWKLGWNVPTGTEIQGRWNADIAQSGTSVTAANQPHNVRIVSGGAVTFGFTASGAPTVPGSTTLNGATCS